MTLASNLGVAVACLAALGLALWRGMIWIGANVLKPVADRHIKFLDDLSMSQAAMAASVQTVVLKVSESLEHSEQIMQQMEHVMTDLADVRQRVRHIEVHSDSVTVNPPRQEQIREP